MQSEYPDLPDEMVKLLDQFSAEIDPIPNDLVKELDKEPVPETIYHYTDGDGLRGILESGRLWLTDMFYLNDPGELRHGVKPAADALRSAAVGGPPEITTFSRGFDEFFRGGVERSAHYFVCSFSKKDDELGQWRAYADDGRGYAIGFDGAKLESAFARRGDDPVVGNMTFPVIYHDRRLLSIQQLITSTTLNYISEPRGRSLSSRAINGYMNALSAAYSLAVLRTAVFFKHEAYEREGEYRFMQIQQGHRPAENVLFRKRPHELVRYVEFYWRAAAPTALKEIVIGPAAPVDRAELFANDCLRAFHGSQRVNIRRSQLPYRSVR